MDVNQVPVLEAVLLFQQLEGYFQGIDYRKYVTPYLTPFNVDNIQNIDLLPYDPDVFLAGYLEGRWVTDINDPKFKDGGYLLGL